MRVTTKVLKVVMFAPREN